MRLKVVIIYKISGLIRGSTRKPLSMEDFTVAVSATFWETPFGHGEAYPLTLLKQIHA